MANPTLYEEIGRSRIPNTDYVTIILDVWQGDREDIAVGVTRYLALFLAEHVPEEFEFRDRSYMGAELKREQADVCFVWQDLGEIKKGDRDAQNHQNSQEQLLDPERRRWALRHHGELYENFLNAIDTLAEDYSNTQAWEAVDAYRNFHATAHEK